VKISPALRQQQPVEDTLVIAGLFTLAPGGMMRAVILGDEERDCAAASTFCRLHFRASD